ncbi:MAG: DUF6455 family protein [Pelagimonas sp.]|jgi:hypothetical protein|nr:DUF6455 family protein [Pelagimonas sp.]
MKPALGDPSRHFFLTRSVARVMGINLHEKLHDNALSPASYSAMVTRCRACPLAAACETWLAQQYALTECAPPGCCNAAQLEQLRTRH